MRPVCRPGLEHRELGCGVHRPQAKQQQRLPPSAQWVHLKLFQDTLPSGRGLRGHGQALLWGDSDMPTPPPNCHHQVVGGGPSSGEIEMGSPSRGVPPGPATRRILSLGVPGVSHLSCTNEQQVGGDRAGRGCNSWGRGRPLRQSQACRARKGLPEATADAERPTQPPAPPSPLPGVPDFVQTSVTYPSQGGGPPSSSPREG